MKDSKTYVYCTIFVVVLLFVVSVFITWYKYVVPRVYETAKIYNHYVWEPDSIKSGMMVTKDSVSLEKYLEHIDSISRVAIQQADNYIADVDLMISKSSAWMGMWLSIFAIIMTVPTIIQFVMAYRNEGRIEKMLDEGRQEVRMLESKLKCSAKEHRISSIMMCLSSIPDPQLTPSPDEKRQFVNHYIKFLAKEFGEYTILLKDYFEAIENAEKVEGEIEKDNILMVITMLKMSLIRTQCVFSDITQNVQYRIIQIKLDGIYQNVMQGKTWGDKLIASFGEVTENFDELISSLAVD